MKYSLLFVFLLSLCFNLPASPLPSDSTSKLEEQLKNADELYRSGKFISARKIYLKNTDTKTLTDTRRIQLARCLTLPDCDHKDFLLAFETFQEFYNKGNSSVASDLGKLYLNGSGVEKDEKKGIELIEEAIKLDDPAGFYYKGLHFNKKADYDSAVKYYLLAAERGHAMAMNDIGYYYEKGRSVEQDYHEAIKWYRKSAAKGNGVAYSNIGWWYYNGKGGTTDYDSAFTNFQEAESQGVANQYQALGLGHCYSFGYGTEIRIDSALYFYKIAGESGKARGYSRIGFLYEKGIRMPQNTDSAIAYYIKGIKNEDSWACIKMAQIFKEGLLIPKNDTAAFQLIAAAAASGDSQAKAELAIYYKNGIGVEQSMANCLAILKSEESAQNEFASYYLGEIEDSRRHEDQAIKHLTKAAELGNGNAMYYLYRIYSRKHLKAKSNLDSLWLQKAANANSTEALFSSALKHLAPADGNRDSALGISLLMKAANQGHVDAIDMVALYLPDWHKNSNKINNNTDRAIDYTQSLQSLNSMISERAEKGDSLSQYMMGVKYLNGIGVPIDYSTAIMWFQQAAAQNHAESYLRLGYMYQNGMGVAQSYQEAMAWYEMAAAQNNSQAINNIGALYYKGYGVKTDLEKAIAYYQKAADSDNGSAQCNLAFYYLYEKSNPKKDYDKGIKLLTQAAENGFSTAQASLGYIYIEGEILKKDLDTAEFWLSKSVSQNDSKGMIQLARLYSIKRNGPNNQTKELLTRAAKLGDEKAVFAFSQLYNINEILSTEEQNTAFKKVAREASQGNMESKILLIHFHTNGIGNEADYDKAIQLAKDLYNDKTSGVNENDLGNLYSNRKPPNYQEAVKWYLIAANNGSDHAQFRVGLYFYNNKSEPNRDSLTFTYFKDAANQNHSLAMLYLYDCYGGGIGTPKNQKMANTWLKKSAQNGLSSAQGELGTLYFFGDRIEKNADSAKYWLEKSALQGNPDALNNLGECYYIGFGTAQDYEKAAFYYQQAVDKNSAIGKMSLAVLYLNGHGVAKDIQKAKDLFSAACEGAIEEACLELKKLNNQ